jgi:WD40 repeat protein
MTERDVFIAALGRVFLLQRRAYLDGACAERPELREQVEVLLRLHQGAGSFLESPAGEATPATRVDEPAEQASPEAPGSFVGPYKLVEPIGEGGMGTVWMAQQRRLTPRQRLELFVGVCSAVQHAHQKGIIHRDIKPSNVLVAPYDDKPVPKVIDFGVAKAAGQQLTDRTLVTGFGAVVGTLEYMSPEQAELNNQDVDTRPDVYSLGVLLYELLTGSTPFSRKDLDKGGSVLEMLRVIREEEPTKPSAKLSTADGLPTLAASRGTEPTKLARLVRGELDWIVMKTLEKDRNRRYESASGFAADVQRYLNDEPVLACPPSAWYGLRKFARRNKAAALAAGSVALGAILAVGGLVIALVIQSASNTRIKEEQRQTKEANEQLMLARADAVADAYRGLWGETSALRQARPAGWRETALDNLRRLALMDTPRRDLVELRSEAVACLSELDAREVFHLPGHTEAVYGLDFTPDGKALASAGYDGRVFIWDTDDARELRKITDPNAAATGFWGPRAPLPVVRFRPGGGYLAYTTWGRRVELLGWGARPAGLPALEGPAPPRDLAFDRKGGLLAVSWANGQVGLFDAATGKGRRTIEAGTSPVGFYMPVALGPEGDRVATRGPGETVQVHAVAGEGKPRTLGAHEGVVRSLAFSPDGKLLASASEDRTAKLWDVARGKEILTLHGHTSKVIGVAFSPDGELVATSGDDQTLRLWEVRTGRPLLVVHPGWAPQAVAFSPDGRRLAGSSTTVAVYELAPRLGRQLPAHGHITTALAIHPRKPVIASASLSNDVTLRDLASGQELRQWKGLPGRIGNLAFSPDGRLLAAAPFARFHSTFFLSGDVSLLETETGKVRKRFTGAYSAAVAFDPAGQRLALGDQRGGVTLYDVAADKVVSRWQVTKGWISEVAFVEGGSQLLVAEIGGVLRTLDAASGHTLRQKTLPRGLPRFAVDRGRRHVAASDLSGQVRILTIPDLEVVGSLEPPGEARWTPVGFSDDGRWLATGADRQVTIYSARTFRKVHRFPTQTGVVVEAAFEPGGHRLAVAGVEELITVWDVSRVETALAEVGLGWVESQGEPVAAPARSRPWRRGQPVHSAPPEWIIWLSERALETDPDQPEICVELAWFRVMGAKKFRDPAKALAPAVRAVELAPGNPVALNTLGVVYYRLGRWKEAIETLRASGRASRDGPTAYDLFFLALAYGETGQKELAGDCFDRAERRWRTQARPAAHEASELRAIRAEAAELLGVKEKKE